MKQNYSEDEVNAILKRAIDRQPLKDEMTREQLESIASELGISPEDLRKAEEEWQAEHEEESYREEFLEEQRRDFRRHLTSYVGVIGFLSLMNLIVSPGFFWAVFPMLGWGLGLFFHFSGVYLRAPKEVDDEYHRWLTARITREMLAGQRTSPLPYAGVRPTTSPNPRDLRSAVRELRRQSRRHGL